MKKILYIPSLNLPVYFWRIEAYANSLVKFKDRCAVHVVFLVSMSDNIAWDKICIGHGEASQNIQQSLDSACQFYDVIIFQRVQFKEGIALLRKLKEKYPKVKFIAEIDDAIGDIPPSNINYDRFKDHHAWSAMHMLQSDAVITSTEYLKNDILRLQDEYNKEAKDKVSVPIHVAPNCVDYTSWKYKRNRKTYEELRIGYVAGAGHDEDLHIAYRAMLPILDNDKNIRFIIRYGGCIPEYFKEHPQIDFERVNWHISKYAQELYDLKLDIALGPLRDTNFNRCKSNLRWLEFATLGTPLVASAVEPFNNTNGIIYLSSNDVEDFEYTISRCINEYELNGFDHKKLKKQCKQNYNIFNECSKLLDFIDNLQD